MEKYRCLTKYLLWLEKDKIGEWVFDHKSEATIEHPRQMPYVSYTTMIFLFIDDVYDFSERNKELGLNHYDVILEENGIKWSGGSMEDADVSEMDGRGVMALIMGAVRAERFCDGALLHFFKNGTMRKWLERLKEIDNAKRSGQGVYFGRNKIF